MAATGTRNDNTRAAEVTREPETGTFVVVHGLALRGTLERLPAGSEGLVQAGLVHSTAEGYALTPLGHRRHRALLEMERRTFDLTFLEMAYAPLPAVTARLFELAAEWQAEDDPRRRRLVDRICAIAEAGELIVRRSAAIAPRFANYVSRLESAKRRLLSGNLEYAVGRRVESILTVWVEMNEDYLQTLGCASDRNDL